MLWTLLFFSFSSFWMTISMSVMSFLNRGGLQLQDFLSLETRSLSAQC